MSRYNRLASAVILALALALPAWFKLPWRNDVAAYFVIVTNLPGILLVGRHYPPEGYPGESPVHFVIMLLVQVLVWYVILTIALRYRRK